LLSLERDSRWLQQGDGFGLAEVGLGVDFDALVGDANCGPRSRCRRLPQPPAMIVRFAARAGAQFATRLARRMGSVMARRCEA
jgi:hypothetical protein